MGSSSPSLVSAHIADENSTGIMSFIIPVLTLLRVLKYSLCGVSGMFTRAFRRARHTRTEMRVCIGNAREKRKMWSSGADKRQSTETSIITIY
jgi:hypothetical protein